MFKGWLINHQPVSVRLRCKITQYIYLWKITFQETCCQSHVTLNNIIGVVWYKRSNILVVKYIRVILRCTLALAPSHSVTRRFFITYTGADSHIPTYTAPSFVYTDLKTFTRGNYMHIQLLIVTVNVWYDLHFIETWTHMNLDQPYKLLPHIVAYACKLLLIICNLYTHRWINN